MRSRVLYVSIGFTDFGNDILHDCISETDVTDEWMRKKQTIISEYGVYPNIRYNKNMPVRMNTNFRYQDQNYERATTWLTNNWSKANGKVLDTVHPDWINYTWDNCVGYHLMDRDIERQHKLYKNRLRARLFNENMSVQDRHYFAFTRDPERKVFTENLIEGVVDKINAIHNVKCSTDDFIDRSLFIPLYMLRTPDTLTDIASEQTALEYFVQDRVKKHRDVNPETFVFVDDQKTITEMGADYNEFMDKYERATA